MKKFVLKWVVIATCFWSCSLLSQTGNEMIALGMPGDNLNLYAVLDVFQQSKTLEEFERTLNSQNSNINNLDLNNDNIIDYISVISFNQGGFHSIVLRVSINSYEYQDVAVIEVSKNNQGNVVVQIIGDEALYGKNYVLEPSVRVVSETPNPGYIGNKTIVAPNYVYGNGIVYISDWPIIMYLYSPLFSIYVSPWHWGYFPSYWSPWSPILYYNYWSFHNHYYESQFYHRASYIRFPSHHSYYLRRRTTSSVVTRNRERGTYDRTYEGRNYRRPVAPPRATRSDIRRESRESIRQQAQPSTRAQANPSIRREKGEATRQQTQPTTRAQANPSIRRENGESTRQQTQPTTRPQTNPSIRRENGESTRRQTQPTTRRKTSPTIRRENRGLIQQGQSSVIPQSRSSIRQSERQSARVTRQSNRSNRQKSRP
ncbi:hypothetical protein AB3G33_07895 [Flavobacterium sp. WC2421]|uniref:DUF3300 domain-containing protein n=1 Tax=Flavobacterium sp. WC2409 TaxID=3234139 RepID=A0AB39W496_9FLAO